MSSFGTKSRLSSDPYRAQTAADRPITLCRRRCACGKVITAKQLVQYGACAKCVRKSSGEVRKAA